MDTCKGSGRRWGSGTGAPICRVCRRGPRSLGVAAPVLRLGRWTGRVPDHAARAA